jgi:hypothetical protein
MNPPTADRRTVLLRRIRVLIVVFSVFLVLSGLTAMPVEWELNLLAHTLGLPPDANPQNYTGLQHWIAKVREGVVATDARYPFMAYGLDWLAFAHIVLGILFLGIVRDPVRNLWVITFGMIACALVIPWALLVGPLRGIPLYWSLIDCSFGVFGILPLALARRYATRLAAIEATLGDRVPA